MTKDLADELERLAKEATPGEWRVTEPWSGFSSLKAGERLVFGLAAGCDEERRPASECDANAALIVAYRNNHDRILSALRAKPEGEPVAWRDREAAIEAAARAYHVTYFAPRAETLNNKPCVAFERLLPELQTSHRKHVAPIVDAILALPHAGEVK